MSACFITFEGIEGAGKTTHMQFACTYLEKQGVSVVQTREPGGTALGERIRALLLDDELPAMAAKTELMLMFAARVEHIDKVIQPALTQGQWVLSDRFYDASYAYQGYGRGMDLALIDQLKSFSVGELKPDLSLLFDLDLETSAARVTGRGKADRFEQEQADFFSKVRAGYLALAKQEPARIQILDACQTIDKVQQGIEVHLAALLEAQS
mgnify:FL=1|jgi:dTMP kinase